MKFQKKIKGGGGVGPEGGWGGQSRCERRSEVFVKIQKQLFFSGGGGGLVGGGGGVMVDGHREVKFL